MNIGLKQCEYYSMDLSIELSVNIRFVIFGFHVFYGRRCAFVMFGFFEKMESSLCRLLIYFVICECFACGLSSFYIETVFDSTLLEYSEDRVGTPCLFNSLLLKIS